MAARKFAESAGVAAETASRLAIVVEELITNLFDHGNLGRADQVTLEIEKNGGDLELVLSDPGPAFDPRSLPIDRAVPSRGGGAGLDLVRTWATTLDYCSQDGINRLALRLPAGTSDP